MRVCVLASVAMVTAKCGENFAYKKKKKKDEKYLFSEEYLHWNRVFFV